MTYNSTCLVRLLTGSIATLMMFLCLPTAKAQLHIQPTTQQQLLPGDMPSVLSFRLPAVSTPNAVIRERIMTIKRTDPASYERGVILIKTRSEHIVSKGSTALQSSVYSSVFSSLGVVGISAPFALERGKNIQLQSVAKAQASIGIERILEVRYNSSIDAYDACRMLASNPDIEYATPVFIRKQYAVPNDPQWSQQYAMQRIKAAEAFDLSSGAPAVTIAIIDSGTDFEHEDLAANLAINSGEDGNDSQNRSKRTNGIDDDNNGKIDDWRGWDFIGNITRDDFIAGNVREDNDPKVRTTPITDQLNHGTGVAGCAAAVTNNSRGVASPGNRCRFIPIKCGSDNAQFANVILRGYEAITYAARLGAKVINCSWGGPGSSPAEQDIINAAVAGGAVVVVASGNDDKNIDNELRYPASYDNVLCVGSTMSNDRRSGFSNYGIAVDVYAPGSSIRTTRSGNSYDNPDGTSFACPITAGVAGLIRSLHPDWTPRQVMHQLRSTCEDVVATDPDTRRLYYGRINAFNALNVNKQFNQAPTAPGLEIASFRFNGQPAITSVQSNCVITVENLLASTSNIRVELELADGTATFAQTQFSINAIPATSSATVNTTVTVSNPYFTEGTVKGIAVITAANGYVNYQPFSIDINLTTDNTYSLSLPYSNHTWTAGYARAPITQWAVGRSTQNRAVVARGTSSFDSTTINDILTGVYGISGSSALLGTLNGRIQRTTNSGSNWTPVNVSSITAAIHSINMYGNNDGIFVGSPINSSWFCGRTTDGGATWTQGSALPTPLQGGEFSSNAAVSWVGDAGWMGTSRGRCIYTTDRGATWSSSTIASTGIVTQLSFSNAQLGYALVRTSVAIGSTATVYVTTDGGRTWQTTGYNFSQNGVHPVALYAPTNSRQCVAVCQASMVLMTSDSGKTWQPALTKDGTRVDMAFGVTGSSNFTIYMYGQTISTLRIPLIIQQRRELAITQSELNYDTVQSGTSKSLAMDIRNTGNQDARIDSVVITPNAGTSVGEFRLSPLFTLPRNVTASSQISTTVIFRPVGIGERSATLTLYSNAVPSTITLPLRGRSQDTTTSVQEQSSVLESLGVSPNPITSSQAVLSISLTTSEYVTIECYSLRGEKIAELYNGLCNEGTTSLMLSLPSLPNGAYFVRANGKQFERTIPIIIGR